MYIATVTTTTSPAEAYKIDLDIHRQANDSEIRHLLDRVLVRQLGGEPVSYTQGMWLWAYMISVEDRQRLNISIPEGPLDYKHMTLYKIINSEEES